MAHLGNWMRTNEINANCVRRGFIYKLNILPHHKLQILIKYLPPHLVKSSPLKNLSQPHKSPNKKRKHRRRRRRRRSWREGDHHHISKSCSLYLFHLPTLSLSNVSQRSQHSPSLGGPSPPTPATSQLALAVSIAFSPSLLFFQVCLGVWVLLLS